MPCKAPNYPAPFSRFPFLLFFFHVLMLNDKQPCIGLHVYSIRNHAAFNCSKVELASTGPQVLFLAMDPILFPFSVVSVSP